VAVKKIDLDVLGRMAEMARRYADQCAEPNQRAYLFRKPGKSLPPDLRKQVLDVADVKVDGHVVVFLRSMAWELDLLVEILSETTGQVVPDMIQ
jgi:hypothetical protein